MISNIIYSLLFGVLNMGIYFVLNRNTKFNKRLWIIPIIVIIFHVGIFDFNGLMSRKDFFNILLFSLALILLHFGALIQLRGFNKLQEKASPTRKEMGSILLRVFDFIRNFGIYIGITLYQVLAIWYPNIR